MIKLHWRFPIAAHILYFVWHIFALVCLLPFPRPYNVPTIMSWFGAKLVLLPPPESTTMLSVLMLYKHITNWAITVQFLFFVCSAIGDVAQVLIKKERFDVKKHIDRFFLVYWPICATVGGNAHLQLIVAASNGIDEVKGAFFTELWALHGQQLWFCLPELIFILHDPTFIWVDIAFPLAFVAPWEIFYWSYHSLTGKFVYGDDWPWFFHVLLFVVPVLLNLLFRLIWRGRMAYYWCLRRDGKSHMIMELNRRKTNLASVESMDQDLAEASDRPQVSGPVVEKEGSSTGLIEQKTVEEAFVEKGLEEKEEIQSPSCYEESCFPWPTSLPKNRKGWVLLAMPLIVTFAFLLVFSNIVLILAVRYGQ